jgi:serralysin
VTDVPSNFATEARFDGVAIGNTTNSGSFSSSLEFVGDEDWIQVRLVAGTQYSFTLHAFDPTIGFADASLTLLDGNGNQVGFDEDSGSGLSSFLTINPATTGMFFVAVTSHVSLPADYVVTVATSSGLTKHELTTGDDIYTGVAGDLILGGLGNDTINVGAAPQAYGDEGNDIINGSIVGARLFGGLGDDTVNGGGGSEFIFGDAGNDSLHGSSGGDEIFGGTGDDGIDGGDGADELLGGEGNDGIFGGFDAVSDLLYGNDGNDTLDGGAGNDLMSGDAGDDIYVVDNSGDLVSERYGSGVDIVRSSIAFNLADTAHVFDAIENLTLTGALAISGSGNNSANLITGNNAANTLDGRLGSDTLRGLGGNDKLIGGLGNDTLTGGANNDFFVFNTAPNFSTNRDVVTDFNHVQDTFQLDNAVFTKLGANGALKAAFFHAGAAAADADDHIIYNHATGALIYDSNGSAAGGGVQIAVLTNKPVLLANDFVVI